MRPWSRPPRVVILHGEADAPLRTSDSTPKRSEGASLVDAGARGGIAISASAMRPFGLVPLGGDLMAGARLQIVSNLPTESSRWLESAVLGAW